MMINMKIENVKQTKVVIIDEIFILSQKKFYQLEAVCRTKHDKRKYFCGLQVILCGDFYLLPPVPDDLHNDSGSFCFESEVFKNCVTHKINWKKVMRQEEDLLVQSVRETALGNISDEVDKFLKRLERTMPADIETVHLFSRNIDATIFSNESLNKLNGDGMNNKPFKLSSFKKNNCPVILLIDLGGKLVNGLKGCVKSLQDDSVTDLFSDINQTHDIKRHLFSKYGMTRKCVVAEREQFSLVLGYESLPCLPDFSCCSNNQYMYIKKTTEPEAEGNDSDSDFDLEEIDFIEQNLMPDPELLVTCDEDMQMLFPKLFLMDLPEIFHALYKEIVHKYLMVCHKQLLKDTKDKYNVIEKKAHRHEIKRQICAAYEVPFARSMKKKDIADVLREKIVSVYKVLNPDILSVEASEPSTSTSVASRTRNRARAPGKGKAKGKRAALTKYNCKRSSEEYIDGEEWLQCDECQAWFQQKCEDIPDEMWDTLQTGDVPLACSECSS
ncbi:LOW QUALITY PROTEIN: PIF1-like protein [Mya arenaria]|uniref:ATP-dependent DNA helicase n=1 Tax=Mya arenaria TaxID=6604 RepID=A0ABY7EJR6_MYAAR|nr:LOW QUALITY PROTEIN: PIF1-like protein [Mya arenaria]